MTHNKYNYNIPRLREASENLGSVGALGAIGCEVFDFGEANWRRCGSEGSSSEKSGWSDVERTRVENAGSGFSLFLCGFSFRTCFNCGSSIVFVDADVHDNGGDNWGLLNARGWK